MWGERAMAHFNAIKAPAFDCVCTNKGNCVWFLSIRMSDEMCAVWTPCKVHKQLLHRLFTFSGILPPNLPMQIWWVPFPLGIRIWAVCLAWGEMDALDVTKKSSNNPWWGPGSVPFYDTLGYRLSKVRGPFKGWSHSLILIDCLRKHGSNLQIARKKYAVANGKGRPIKVKDSSLHVVCWILLPSFFFCLAFLCKEDLCLFVYQSMIYWHKVFCLFFCHLHIPWPRLK